MSSPGPATRRAPTPRPYPADFGIAPEVLVDLLRQRPRAIALKAILLVGIWVGLGAAVLAVPSLWLRFPLWLVLGFFINGLVQFGHETWHDNLLPKRWQNTIAGTALGWLVFLVHKPLKHDHLAHHKFNRTSRDPDAYGVGRKSVGLWVLFYAVVFLSLPLSIIYFNLLYPLQHFTRRQLAWHAVTVSLYAASYLAVAAALAELGWLREAALVWLIPVLFTSPYNGFKSIADHYNNDWRGHRFRTATTVRSNPVVTYFWNGLNYHLDHHIFPKIPGTNLAALHAHLRPTLASFDAPVYDNYLAVMVAAFAAGPDVVDEDIALVTLKKKGPP